MERPVTSSRAAVNYSQAVVDSSAFIQPLALLLVVIAGLIVLGWKTRSVGLVAGFSFQIWMYYWLGGLIHAFPWAQLEEDEAVVIGVRYAGYAMLAFAAGAVLIAPAIGKAMVGKARGPSQPMDPGIPRRCIIYGMVAYFILAPTIGNLPSGSSVVAAGSQLVVVGFCLSAYMTLRLKGGAAAVRGLLLTALIPLVILARQGFMSFGILALSVILVFVGQFYRPRWAIAAALLALAYPGLSLYVTYMRDRTEIRESVWGGEDMGARLARIWQTLSSPEAFNPMDPAHLERVDGRLNQAYLVGEAVDNLSRTDDFAHGTSILIALEGMIPRIIWPDKPPSGGSGDLVSRFTGREFAVGTSVGVGPILEFYGNFGVPGVLVGFFILGALIRGIDFASAVTLERGQWGDFVVFMLIGISFLNVCGSLIEVTASGMASLLVGRAIRNLIAGRRAPAPAVAVA